MEVITAAKTNLKPGDVLDGFGGYLSYGLAENYAETAREDLLPIGLAEGCRVLRPIAKDQILTRADVCFPIGRLCDRLREEQDALQALFAENDQREAELMWQAQPSRDCEISNTV